MKTPDALKTDNGMTFEEKKQAVLAVHKNKISRLSGPSYGNVEYVCTSVASANGAHKTVKCRTEQRLFDKLYHIYFVPAKNEITEKGKMYGLKDICRIFGFREDHAMFLLGRQTDKEILNPDRLSYSDILYLIANGCQSTGKGDVQKIQNILDENSGPENTVCRELIRLQSENTKLQEQLSAIRGIIGCGHADTEPEPKQQTEKKKWSCIKNDPDLPELTVEEAQWTDRAKKAVYEIAKLYKCQYATVIRRIYAIMQKEYMLDWAEITKEVLEACEKPPGTNITKLRIVAYDARRRDLFDKIVQEIDQYMP